MHPDTAAVIRDRKVAAIARTGAPQVASANPGCQMWLAAGGVAARHPVDIIDEALHGR
jgi:Fe-S oxidoreductase